MIPPNGTKSWYEYGVMMTPIRNQWWDELTPKKKAEIFKNLNNILGDGWEERICK